VGHLQDNGFEVIKTYKSEQELRTLKRERRVPEELESCHTSLVDGYIIEGHVPGSTIATLLQEKPDIVGLAVPKMGLGPPGMEGTKPLPYTIWAFTDYGKIWVYQEK
jgi:hypothetical protein